MKLKVLSYNIHKGFSSFGTEFTLHEIKKQLRMLNPDLVLLQEVVGENHHHHHKTDGWPTEGQFEFLADKVWPHYSYGKNAIFPNRHHGNVILSKYPIIEFENIDISNNRWERRGLLHAVLEIPRQHKQKLHVFNVHLDLFSSGRRRQFHRIVERAKQFVPADDPLILGGDFNDWNQKASPIFQEFLGLEECFYQNQGRTCVSYPSFFPLLNLDRIYFRHMKVQTTVTLRKKPWSMLSDHLPILAEFELF